MAERRVGRREDAASAPVSGVAGDVVSFDGHQSVAIRSAESAQLPSGDGDTAAVPGGRVVRDLVQ